MKLKTHEINNQYAAITLDLTEGCNLACSYCFTYSEHKKKVMSFEKAKEIIRAMCKERIKRKQTTLHIAFWGGEPLLEYKLIQKIILYCEDVLKKEYGMTFIYSGTTNGVLLTVDIAKWCKEYNFQWLISYDGIKESHDCSRVFPNGKGSHEIVLNNILTLQKAGFKPSIRASLSLENSKYFFQNIKHYIEDLKIPDFAFSPVFEDDWTDESFIALEKQMMQTVEYIVERRKRTGEHIILKHLNDEALYFVNGKTKNKRPCGAGRSYVGISIDGVMYPCHRFNKHGQTKEERLKSSVSIGYIENETLIETNKKLRATIDNFASEPSAACLKCDIFGKAGCDGGCIAVQYDLTGDIHKPSEKVCKYAAVLRRVGVHLAKEYLKHDLHLSRSSVWGGPKSTDVRDHACICNNACHAEGSYHEITVRNNNITGSCMCNNTNYTGDPNEQFRPIYVVDKERADVKKYLELSRRIILTHYNEKSEEQRALEAKVLQKTLNML